MDHSSWLTATRPKVQGSWNLHNIMPQNVDFFIFLSSVAGIVGSPAQSNYAAGNTYQDALAAHRLSRGQKAVSLDLGWMADDGYVTQNARALQNMRSGGFFAPMSQQELFALLDSYCDPNRSLDSLSRSQIVLGLELPAMLRAKGIDEPSFMRTPIYFSLQIQGTNGPLSNGGNPTGSQGKNPAALLGAATSSVEASSIVTDCLSHKLCHSLGLGASGINPAKPLYEYGVDSLLALELKNWCAKVLASDVSVLELLGAESLSDLAAAMALRSKYCNYKETG
jgi:KR domain/Phosphopantetheine attachment site